jgi:hypothetical protein
VAKQRRRRRRRRRRSFFGVFCKGSVTTVPFLQREREREREREKERERKKKLAVKYTKQISCVLCNLILFVSVSDAEITLIIV